MTPVLRHRIAPILWYTLTVFMIISLIFFGITLYVQHQSNLTEKEAILQQAQGTILTSQAVLTGRLSRVVSDLLFLKDSFQTITAASMDDASLQQVSQQWLAFSARKKIFDQIRYIDLNGDEQLRINRMDGHPERVAESLLQNKANRYYFTNTIALPEDHVYVSPMDLNIENGEIEIPLKPTLRLSTPVRNPQNETTGLIVINYLGDDLFRQIRQIIANNTGSFFMLNENGYWLYNSEDHQREWGFMYPDRVDDQFQQQFPEEWAYIQQNKSGSIITDHGAFIFDQIFSSDVFLQENKETPVTLGCEDWYFLLRISPDSPSGKVLLHSFPHLVGTTLREFYYVYIMILLIAFVIALLRNITLMEQRQVKLYAEYDLMTGALNRRAGLEKLYHQYIGNQNQQCVVSVCFMDINGLKEINDTFGHDAGDELIRSVAAGIQQNIRVKDTLIRLGGDEFMIVFEGLDEPGCELIWQRIRAHFDEINQTENRKYLISVSHGIETLHCAESHSIDPIINKADAKMYEEKKLLKADLHVIRASTSTES